MSRIFLIVVFLWSGSVNSYVITDFNKSLLEKAMNINLDSGSNRIGFVYPGTKWCGPGNIADNNDDLGTERETDMCCRDHDNCPDIIRGGETKYNLTNPTFYTRVRCDCDLKFRSCLHDANKLSANIIGTIYFDGLDTKCFNKTFPATGCAERGGFLDSKCLRYNFDTNGEAIYQFFDVPVY